MKHEDLVKMSVKELKDRLKDLNTQAQAAAGKDLDTLLEEATTITGILDDVKNREKLAGIAKDAEGGAEPTGGEKGEEVKNMAVVSGTFSVTHSSISLFCRHETK